MVEHLSSMRETLGSISSAAKTKQTRIYFLTVLKTGSLRSGYRYGGSVESSFWLAGDYLSLCARVTSGMFMEREMPSPFL